MNVAQKIQNIAYGICTLLCAVLLAVNPEEGYAFVAFLLTLALIIGGIRALFYYFTMSRHMVGGKAILYNGILLLDFGLFTLTLSSVPGVYILVYLLACHAFSGFVDILRSLEARHYHSGSWRWSFVNGIVNLGIAVICVVFVHSISTAVYIYCIGLIYSGITRISSAFRKTAIVYVQ